MEAPTSADRPRRALFIADILFGPPAAFAPEGDEVWLGLPDFVPGHHHEGSAVYARRILSGIQRVEQEFLVARHGVLLSRPNLRPRAWLLARMTYPETTKGHAGITPHASRGGVPISQNSIAAEAISQGRKSFVDAGSNPDLVEPGCDPNHPYPPSEMIMWWRSNDEVRSCPPYSTSSIANTAAPASPKCGNSFF
jgi:hypothetical protein